MTDRPETRPAKIEKAGRRSGGFVDSKDGQRKVKGTRGSNIGGGNNSSTPNARWRQDAFGRRKATAGKGKIPQGKQRFVNGILIDRRDDHE